jgi:hypothetical protein
VIELRSRVGGEDRCPLCQDGLAQASAEDRYSCNFCRTDYHLECLLEFGGCSTLGCERKGQALPRAHVQALRGSLAEERREADVLARASNDADFEWGLYLGANAERLPGGRVKLELDTPLESAWMWLGLLAFLGLLGGAGVFFGQGEPAPLIVSAAALLAVVVMAKNTDNYYVLDREDRALLYRRQFFQSVAVKHVARFDEVFTVTVDGRKQSSKQGTWWEYCLVLVLKNADTIRVSDWSESSHASFNRAAESLAAHMQAPYKRSPMERALKVRRDRTSGQITVLHEEPWNVGLLIAAVIFAILLVGGFLSAVLGT